MLSNSIEEAIEERSVLRILYNGTWREVEPHLLGYNRRGNLCLSAFQRAGGSGFEFRAFLLHQIAAVEATGQTFDGPRAGYNPHDSTMQSIIARI